MTTDKLPKGRADAINQMCKQCIYDPSQKGSWRQQVEQCTGKSCPLYTFRPLPSGVKHAKD